MTDMDMDEADELLMDAVDAVSRVRNEYEGLTEEQAEYLDDAKSSVAAVALNLDGPVVFDLD